MKFTDIFKKDNDYNEKNIVGVSAFTVMVLFSAVDIFTGYFGKDLVVHEYIYDSFVYLTLGSFGITETGKIFSQKAVDKPQD